MRDLQVRRLGRMPWASAFELQRDLAEQRKRGDIPDQYLLVEHPHTLTLGRNGHEENLLASSEELRRRGVEFHHTDRGGDITYHGPGQIVGYPIIDLREWKRDVVAYVRALEQSLIDTLSDFGIDAERSQGETGVWVDGAKVAAIGIHISRWVTTHGFALNHTTDLSYFGLIVPCGLRKPVTSLAELGCQASREHVEDVLVSRFCEQFQLHPVHEECATLERT